MARTPSPSKGEAELAALVVAEMKALGYDEAYVDAAGNAVGRIRGQEEGPGWLLLTHLDHVDVGDEARWPYPPFSGHGELENTPGVRTDPDHPLVRQMEAVRRSVFGPGPRPGLWAFATDGRYTHAAGIPTVGFGPGDPTLAHTEHEYIQIEKLLAGTRYYKVLVQQSPHL